MEIKQQIEKMNRESCVPELQEASKLTGKETDRELNIILEKCECIRIAVLFNGFKGK